MEFLNLGTYVKLGPFKFFPADCRTPVTCKIRPSKDQLILNFVGFLVETMTSKSLFEINFRKMVAEIYDATEEIATQTTRL